MITLVLLFFPLLAALGAWMLRKESVKVYALVSAIFELGICAYALQQFILDPASEALLVDYWWMKDLGISFHLGLDGISILLVALTNLLTPLIILSSFRNNHTNAGTFYALIFIMQFALNGVFMAMDGFLFYIFWELALLPI